MTSWVWTHFKKNGPKAVCQVPDAAGKECGVELIWKHSTAPLSYHLTEVHKFQKGEPAKKQRRISFGSQKVQPSVALSPVKQGCVSIFGIWGI